MSNLEKYELYGQLWASQVVLLLSGFSLVWLLVTPWSAAYQAPPSMGFSRQAYWSGLPLLSPPMRRWSIYSPKEVLVLIWASFRSGTHYLEDLDPQEEGSWDSRTREIKMRFSISLWGLFIQVDMQSGNETFKDLTQDPTWHCYPDTRKMHTLPC